jgi:hypothetical protein
MNDDSLILDVPQPDTRMTRTRPTSLSAELRKKKEIELYISGKSYPEIVDIIKADEVLTSPPEYDAHTVALDIHTELKRIKQENSERLVNALNIEIIRLDKIFSPMFDAALEGDWKAANVALNIIKERAKLLRLYGPTELRVTDWRDKILKLLDEGKITVEEINERFGNEIARQIFDRRRDSPNRSRDDSVIDGTVSEVAG